MRLTTKGRFAVTAMMDIALRDAAGPVSLASVSERQKISLSYLEQLFGKLRRVNLVDSMRGPGGGYSIAQPLNQVTIADIVHAVDERLDATQCSGREDCQGEHRCMTHELWTTLNAKMFEYLASVTLGELVEQQRQKLAVQPVPVAIRDKRPRRRNSREKAVAAA
ncbi:MAG: Rrf2 family transcriptional regulator [Azonexus sp.]|jgi:Rrf2 family iron-sulfur cluster assembly transcriptional regulator|nr:Rrf2 family transcriptional regulator [Azonexus sp.]